MLRRALQFAVQLVPFTMQHQCFATKLTFVGLLEFRLRRKVRHGWDKDSGSELWKIAATNCERRVICQCGVVRCGFGLRE